MSGFRFGAPANWEAERFWGYQTAPFSPWRGDLGVIAVSAGSVPKVGVSIRFWRAGEACPRKTDIV